MNLLPDQEEKLVNFQAITEHWDTESSIQILERNNWSLEKATSEFMTNSYANEDLLQNFESSAFESPPRQMHYIPSEITAALNRDSPPNIPAKTGFFNKVKAFFEEIITPQNSDFSKAAEVFEQKVKNKRPQWTPKFFTGTLKNVIIETNKVGRMLVMYICSEQISADYTIQTLCNQVVVGLLSQYYVIWAVDRETSDGTLAEKLLRSSSYPCLAIISTQNIEKPVVLAKLQGQCSVEQVIQFLSAQVSPIISYNPRQVELERERQLRASQEQELREAERILKERVQQEELKKQNELLKKQMEIEEKQKRENLRQAKIDELGPEPKDSDATFVSFRLPNGSKLERRFDKGRKVQALYDFLEISNCSGIEILFGFPSTVIDNLQQSLEEAGLHPKALVIVRKVENA